MRFTTHFRRYLPVVASLIPVCHGATITLYDVATKSWDPTNASRPSITLSPIGVGQDGATTYAEQLAASVFVKEPLEPGDVITVGTSTVTIDASNTEPGSTWTTNPAITVAGTYVADASHYAYHWNPKSSEHFAGGSASCNFDGHGGASCVKAAWIAGGPTITETYTGTPIPFYTLITTDDPGKGNDANSLHSGAFATIAVSVLTGVLLVIRL